MYWINPNYENDIDNVKPISEKKGIEWTISKYPGLVTYKFIYHTYHSDHISHGKLKKKKRTTTIELYHTKENIRFSKGRMQ